MSADCRWFNDVKYDTVEEALKAQKKYRNTHPGYSATLEELQRDSERYQKAQEFVIEALQMLLTGSAYDDEKIYMNPVNSIDKYLFKGKEFLFNLPLPVKDIMAGQSDYLMAMLNSFITDRRDWIDSGEFTFIEEEMFEDEIAVLNTLLAKEPIRTNGAYIEEGNVMQVLDGMIYGTMSNNTRYEAPKIMTNEEYEEQVRLEKTEGEYSNTLLEKDPISDSDLRAQKDTWILAGQSFEIDQIYRHKALAIALSNVKYKAPHGKIKTIKTSSAIRIATSIFIRARKEGRPIEKVLSKAMKSTRSLQMKAVYARIFEIIRLSKREVDGIFVNYGDAYIHGINEYNEIDAPKYKIFKRNNQGMVDFYQSIARKFYPHITDTAEGYTAAVIRVAEAYRTQYYRDLIAHMDSAYSSVVERDVYEYVQRDIYGRVGKAIKDGIQKAVEVGNAREEKNELDSALDMLISMKELPSYIDFGDGTLNIAGVVRLAFFLDIIPGYDDVRETADYLNAAPGPRLAMLTNKFLKDNEYDETLENGNVVKRKTDLYESLNQVKDVFSKVVKAKLNSLGKTGSEYANAIDEMSKILEADNSSISSLAKNLGLYNDGVHNNMVRTGDTMQYKYGIINNGLLAMEKNSREANKLTVEEMNELEWNELQIYKLKDKYFYDHQPINIEIVKTQSKKYPFKKPNELNKREYIQKEFVAQFLGYNGSKDGRTTFLASLLVTDKTKNIQLRNALYKVRSAELAQAYRMNIVAELKRSRMEYDKDGNYTKYENVNFQKNKNKSYIVGLESYSYKDGVYSIKLEGVETPVNIHERELFGNVNSQAWNKVLEAVFKKLDSNTDVFMSYLKSSNLEINNGSDYAVGQISSAYKNIFGNYPKANVNALEELAKVWMHNYTLHSYSLKKSVLSDQAFYASEIDYANRSSIHFTDSFHMKDNEETYDIVIVDDIKHKFDETTVNSVNQEDMNRLYGTEMTVEDSAGFMLPERAEYLRQQYGDTIQFNGVFKPIYSQIVNGRPLLIKYASVELTDEICDRSESLKRKRQWMRDNKVMEIIDKGAVKVGLDETTMISTERIDKDGKFVGYSTGYEESAEGKKYTLQNKFFGAIYDPYGEYDEVKVPNQLFSYLGESLQNPETRASFQKAWGSMYETSRLSLERRINTGKKLRSSMASQWQFEAKNKSVYDMIVNGVSFNYPLLRNKVVSFIHTKFEKSVIGFKFKGDHLVMTPSVDVHNFTYIDERGVTRQDNRALKYVDEDGYCEVIVNKKIYEQVRMDQNGVVYDNEVIGYRTPSGSMRSGLRLKIVGYLPDETNIVYAPIEISEFLGSDYDVDELHFIRKTYIPKYIFMTTEGGALREFDISGRKNPSTIWLNRNRNVVPEGDESADILMTDFMHQRIKQYLSEYKEGDERTHNEHMEALIDIYQDILKNKLIEDVAQYMSENREDMLTQLSFREMEYTKGNNLTENVLEYLYGDGYQNQVTGRNISNPLDAAEIHEAINAGPILIGQYMSLMRGVTHVINQSENNQVELINPVKIKYGETEIELSKWQTDVHEMKDGKFVPLVRIEKDKESIDLETKEKILVDVPFKVKTYHVTETLANAILDHVKHFIINRINLTRNTMYAWIAAVKLGIEPKLIAAVFNQPVILDYENAVWSMGKILPRTVDGILTSITADSEKEEADKKVKPLDVLKARDYQMPKYQDWYKNKPKELTEEYKEFMDYQRNALALYMELKAQGNSFKNFGKIGGLATNFANNSVSLKDAITGINQEYNVRIMNTLEDTIEGVDKVDTKNIYEALDMTQKEEMLDTAEQHGKSRFKNLSLKRDPVMKQLLLTALHALQIDSHFIIEQNPKIQKMARDIMSMLRGLSSYVKEANKPKTTKIDMENATQEAEQIATMIYNNILHSFNIDMGDGVHIIDTTDIPDYVYKGGKYSIDDEGLEYNVLYGIEAFNAQVCDMILEAQKYYPEDIFLSAISIRPDKFTYSPTIYFNKETIKAPGDYQNMVNAFSNLHTLPHLHEGFMLDLYQKLLKYSLLNDNLSYGSFNISEVLPMKFKKYMGDQITGKFTNIINGIKSPNNEANLADILKGYVGMDYITDTFELILQSDDILKAMDASKDNPKKPHRGMDMINTDKGPTPIFYDMRVRKSDIVDPPIITKIHSDKTGFNETYIKTYIESYEYYYYTVLDRNSNHVQIGIMKDSDWETELIYDTLIDPTVPIIHRNYESKPNIVLSILAFQNKNGISYYDNWKVKVGDEIQMHRYSDVYFSNMEKYRVTKITENVVELERVGNYRADFIREIYNDDIQVVERETAMDKATKALEKAEEKAIKLNFANTKRDIVKHIKAIIKQIKKEIGEGPELTSAEDDFFIAADLKITDTDIIAELTEKYCN